MLIHAFAISYTLNRSENRKGVKSQQESFAYPLAHLTMVQRMFWYLVIKQKSFNTALRSDHHDRVKVISCNLTAFVHNGQPDGSAYPTSPV